MATAYGTMSQFPPPPWYNGDTVTTGGYNWIYNSAQNTWTKAGQPATTTTSVTTGTASVGTNLTVGFSGSSGYAGSIGASGSITAGGTVSAGALTTTGDVTANNVTIRSNLSANGSVGSDGQVLVSNSTGGVYWSTGAVGYTGSQGNIGYSGSKGDRGNDGYVGSIGATGNVGYTGSQGPQGTTGYYGSKGDQGNNGYTGSIGATGATGYTGSQGNQGNIGYTGSQGITGYIGSIGATGDMGYTGSQGNQGLTGYIGSQGIIGYTGSLGDTGYIGSQGIIGYTGSKGSGFTPQGEWTGTTHGYYLVNDVVSYNGSSYVCTIDVYGNTPPDIDTIGWTLIASKGDIGYTGSLGATGFVGSQGVIGYSGSKGDIGYTGSYGDTGFIGSRGDIGYTGSFGNTGYVGSYGDTGYTGSKGDIGYVGSIGSKGDQGNIGYSGSKGDIGYSGSQGVIGYSGSKGDIGYVGSIGPQGPQGNFGGETVDYIFNTSTINSDPGTGKIKFDNADLSAASYLFINQNDNYGANAYNFLLTIDASTSSIKGHFMVKDSANNADYSMFAITGSHTYSYPYLTIPVSYLSGSATAFASSQNVIVTFAVTGDKGELGYTGSKGDTGYQGSFGDIGYTGSKGDTGYQGSTGFVGSIGQGFNFLGEWDGVTNYNPYDVVTYNGELYIAIVAVSGYQPFYTFAWTKIVERGYVGSQGDIGYTGSKGDIGYSGSKGDIGYSGSKGDTGYIGSIGVTGYVGSIGATGYVGSIGATGYIGSIGFSGSKGDTGYVGSQGVIGYTGSLGNTGYVGSQGDIGYTGSRGVIGFTGSLGDIGYTGSKGDIGYTGSIGATGNVGYTGSYGDKGDAGYIGSIGATGYVGSIGSKGDTGFVGSQGEQGNIGYTGSKGDQGVTGYIGSIGTTGATGYQGSKGDQGNIGYTGSQGIQGIDGYSGSKGDQGNTGYIGSIGATGYVGSIGATGNDGYQGSKGDQGVTGYIGSTGSTGYQGSKGDQGVIGYSGSKGDQGNLGYTGSQGDQGNTGYTGSQGNQGNIGYTGSIGYVGSTGYVGSKGDAQQANVVFGDTPPSPTYTGLLWFDTNNAIFNAFYQPANTWIGINGGGFGPTGAIGYTGSSGASVAVGYTGSQGVQADLLSVSSNIIPSQSNVFTLGNSTFSFASLYLGSNSITFTDVLTNTSQVLSVANSVFYITTESGSNTQFNPNAGFNAGGIILQNYQIKLANTQQLLYFNSNLGIGNSVANSAQTAFYVSNSGQTTIRNNFQIINPITQTNTAPFIIQSQLGTPQPLSYSGTTFYSINSANLSNRNVYDAYGNGVYVSIAARTSRGTISSPTGLQANDIILRISGNGYRNSGFGSQGSARIDFRSIDSFSDVQTGTQIDFWTTPLGSNVISEVATITATGVTSTSFVAGYGTQNSFINSTSVSTNTTITNYISANGSLGSSKQVLMSSDGTGNVYWQWPNQHFALGANLSLNAASTSAQSLFGVGVQVANNSRYAISMMGAMTYTGGGPAGAGNMGFGFGGTANLSSVYYQTTTLVNANESVTGQAPDYQAFRLTSGFTANSNANPITNFNKAYMTFNVQGIISVANGGTLIPQYDSDHAPSTLTLLAFSSVSLELLGDDNKANSVTGTWA